MMDQDPSFRAEGKEAILEVKVLQEEASEFQSEIARSFITWWRTNPKDQQQRRTQNNKGRYNR